MEELENVIHTIRSTIDTEILEIIDFLERSNLLTYYVRMDKIKDGDRFIEKPTDTINLEFLKICAQEKLVQDEDVLGLCFLRYQGYALKQFKLYWKLNLANLEKDLQNKCSYCQIPFRQCPVKALGFIKKLIADKKLNEREVFERLLEKPQMTYQNNPDMVQEVADILYGITQNALDFAGTEFFIQTNAVIIDKEENGELLYRSLDFKMQCQNLIEQIQDFKANGKGVFGKLSIDMPQFTKEFSYMFDVSPIELAVYLQYLCQQRQISPMEVLKVLHTRCQSSEKVDKLAYYKEYTNRIRHLPCAEEAKQEIEDMVTYMKNYQAVKTLPYIPFNIVLYANNMELAEEVNKMILNVASAYDYSVYKNWIRVDVNTFIRRAKDSIDTFCQIDKIYRENDYVIFYHFDGVHALNEARVEAFWAAIEKYYAANEKGMTIFIAEQPIWESLTKNRQKIHTMVVNKQIRLDDLDIEMVKVQVKNKLRNIFEFDEAQEKKIDAYIETKYAYHEKNSSEYIEEIFHDIVYEEFKMLKNPNMLHKNNKMVLQTFEAPAIQKARDVEEILADFEHLVGIAEVKYLVQQLLEYLEYSKKIDTAGFENLHMFFKGNAGTGKQTVARLLTELLFRLGFIQNNKIIEVTSRDLIGEFIGQTPGKTQKVIDEALDGVLFIDDANTIMKAKGSTTDYAGECISTLIKAMDHYQNRLVVIFSGWTKEMNGFINANQGLASRIGYEIEFPDFTEEELWEIFKTEAEGNDFTLEEKVEERIKTIIQKNKNTRNFGNARFVINLFNSLVLTHAMNCENDESLKKITLSDIQKFEETKKETDRSIDDILGDLNKLIGLDNVKEVINGFVALILFNKKLNRTEDMNMHMIFKGNAGTGKTTVARLLAEIYYELGYIKKNKLIEVQGKDLIGEFLGQTGPKTQAVIESALDGVLFVDEAYSIMQHRGSNASFTDECIATFLKAMEDYQGRLIIIFAGYTEEMKQFRDQNPGLKSRIGFELDFEDYSVEELLQIFHKKLKEKELTIEDAAVEKVKTILENARKVENFGNGRFVDTMLQKIIIQHAIRTSQVDDIKVLTTITAEDIKNIRAEESRKRIGF